MKTEPPPINPHVWRRFKLAEKNMMRFFRAGHHRRARKWAIEMKRWTEKLFR